jgi:hypothetical protein
MGLFCTATLDYDDAPLRAVSFVTVSYLNGFPLTGS